MAREPRRPKSNIESLITGLVVGGGFVAFWAFGGHQTWALFGALFAGLLPAARGISGLIAARGEARLDSPAKKLREQEKTLDHERAILQIAREHGGRLTPALVALDCDMGIAEAERVLDDLAKRGHASVNVRNDGRLEYEFSEFLQQSRLEP
jgi:hypothetical protein